MIYKRMEVDIPNVGIQHRYFVNRYLTKASRIPPDIMEKFEYTDTLEVPDVTKPCLFCTGQATKKRLCNLVMVDLCDFHYYNRSLGKIAQELRERKEHGAEAKVSKTRKQKGKSKTTKG